jgi:hypothetical protein
MREFVLTRFVTARKIPVEGVNSQLRSTFITVLRYEDMFLKLSSCALHSCSYKDDTKCSQLLHPKMFGFDSDPYTVFSVFRCALRLA